MGCTTPPARGPQEGRGEATFFVATDGDDAWSGTLREPNAKGTDGPFATLHRARDAVRALKRRGPVVVMVRGGTYHLHEPLALGPEDSGSAESPVIYCAAPGEEAVLSGGRPIKGWRKGEGELWVADVPEAKAPDGSWHFRQLFVGSERQVRARTPNADPENPITGGWAFVQPPDLHGKKLGAFGACLACIHTPGDTFTWKVDVPADGDYALWLYYGALNKPHGRTDMAGRTTMQADDAEPVPLESLPDTGGWGVFRWSRTASLRLTKGEHRLRWTNVKGGGLNWDAFALCDDPAWTPKGKQLAQPAGKHLIVVHCETFETAKAKEFRVGKVRAPAAKDRFHFKAGDVAPWPRSPEPEIHIFPAWGWVNAILSVDRIDPEKRIAHVTNGNCTQELRPGNRYFVENVREALDTPGEWFLDRAEGRLTYWPKEPGFEAKGVVAPALDRVVEIAGVEPIHELEEVQTDEGKRVEAAPPMEPQYAEHIVLRGFTIRHTRYALEQPSVYSPSDAAIWLHRARHCVVEKCRFVGVGGYAVRLSLGASHNAVIGNTVADGGQGGVLLDGPAATQPTDNLVAGNHVHHCGRIWKHVAGVYVTTGSRNRIAHNTVADVPRYGISLKSFGTGNGSHGNIIEWNRLLRTNLETNDTGAIETLGRDREDSGNIIRHNLILDAVGVKTTEDGEFLTPFYTWGIYLDDYSSGTRVVGNIVARTYRGGIHVHLGRNNHFEHNILVDGFQQQIECNGAEFMTHNTFVRNIIVCREGNLIRVNRWSDAVLAACDHNVYWRPGANLAEAEGSLTPKGTWAAWQAAGYDTHSLVADPLFVDPEKDDYRLRPGSPALELGFQPTDTTKIGVEGYQRPADLP